MKYLDLAIANEKIKTNNEFVKYVRYDDYKKLENIIKEVREYIDKWKFEAGGNGACMNYDDIEDILEILDKGE